MEIQATDLTMKFNDAERVVEVFSNLSFKITTGSANAIVGESGVGKTTLLLILGMLERPVSGHVYYDDCDVWHDYRKDDELARYRGKNIGFVFQSHYLLPEFNAVENVAMPLLIQGVAKVEAFVRAEDLLSRVGLAHRLTHRPGALSGGEQQRVAIARSLSANPSLVLADEPTGNLDHKTGKDVIELLLSIQQEQGMTLVMVTHNLELAASMDRIVELTPNGIVEQEG